MLTINRALAVLLLTTGMLLTVSCKKPDLNTDPKAARSAAAAVAPGTSTPIPLRVLSLAGTGSPAFADGAGFLATFNQPTGIAADNAGNMYIADAGNNRIRKVTPGGVVSTFAGSGGAAFTNGNGTAAAFNHPTALAIDMQGNLFVADSLNNAIRKITPAGDVTTYAGVATGEPGYTEGPASVAQFKGPSGVTVDASGIVYIADAGNNRIRKITTDSQVSLVAGDGNAGYSDLPKQFAEFDTPQGLAVDASSNVYVADKGNNVIRLITAAGIVSTFAGSGGELNRPTSIAIAQGAGTMYVADQGSNKIKTISPTAVVNTLAGNGSATFINGPAASAAFKSPTGIIVTPLGEVYVADQGNNRIREIGSVAVVNTLAGNGTPGTAGGTGTAAQFNWPTGLAVTSSGVFVADANNNKIRLVSLATSQVSDFIGTGEAGLSINPGFATFNSPTDITPGAAGWYYVADCRNHRIRQLEPPDFPSTPWWLAIVTAGSGPFGTSFGGFADGPRNTAQFSNPMSVVVDIPRELVYVADYSNNRIRKITRVGDVSTFAGDGVAGNNDGTGTGARFNLPRGLAIDAAGNVYVADQGNNRIRKITPSGVVSTVAGSTGGYIDGQGTAAAFWVPCDIAVDAAGNMYVADFGNNRVRKISPAGMVTTLAGGDTAGFADGPGPIAMFSGLRGIAVAADGTVYVGDTFNNRIRKIQQ